ncbi:hypothetical protein GQX73_g5132 [Xylaria multiplex]|uniref:Uncharacterized protein n=1 Tax=Xylaria multiplex TaxID=323545 RepID=A0A7C8INS8_9PEZI|nr:hypothetical protein GQX73_g5132 [Xylaria multiplex]
MANALDCPEDANSTDCLLRILIQKIDDHFEEYDWGPITFAFTVPIGFIATLFAAFTIYQAIRTTSRGSRKSNRRAIGEWSCKTTKKWDWHELALISTVRTPTLTTSNVMEALERETPPQASNPQQAPSSSEASNTQEALAKLRKFLLWPFYGTARQDSQKIQSEDPSIASWLGFLAELGLCHSDLPKIRLKNTIADYLPDDLLAAPAYGEVGFIVAAAAAAGAHSWQIDKQWGYPIVMGHSFQFEFRSHPTLGMIGAFVKWNDSPRNRHMLTGRQLKIALLQARGDLDVSAPPSNDFTEGSNEFERLNFLGDSGKGLISHLSSKVVGLNHDCKHGLCWCDELFFAREDQHHLMWFFMASTPSRPPYIFPSKLVRNSNAFKFLALHSNFWASLKTKDLFASVNSKSEAPEFSSSEEWYTKDLPTTIMEGDLDRILKFLDEHTGESKKGTGRGLIPFDLPASTFNNQDCICVFRVVLGPSINFLYDTNEFGTWFNGLKELKQEYFRVLILLQLMQINQWLATRDQEEVMCAIVSLSTTTLALLDMNSSLSNESFGFSSPKEKPIVGVDEDGGDSYLEDDISFPYMRMLQTLGHLLSEVGAFPMFLN